MKTHSTGQRAGVLILVILLLIFTPMFIDITRLSKYSSSDLLTQTVDMQPKTSDTRTRLLSSLISNNKPKNYGVDDPGDPRFYNIIPEDEALLFEPCQDVNKAASVKYSNISLIDHIKRTYNIGEEIRAIVTLYDGYGNRKKSGGDHLRATIENTNLKASAPCVVTDNRDGTHTVVCEALWSGTSTVTVTLAYPREAITPIYRIRTQVLATRNIFALYKSRNYSEKMLCHPNYTHLMKHTNYTELCNMTYRNSGMPFYCGKPQNEHLLCQDWEQAGMEKPLPYLKVTKCEDELLRSGQHNLKKTLKVEIQKRKEDKNVSIIQKPSIPCSKYPVSNLWRSREPTGFFYNQTWILRNCHGVENSQHMNCLKNRHLYLFGDSTSRDWYKSIIKRFNCKPISEQWTKEKWHKEAKCFNKQINFKAGWYPHAQPFYLGGGDDVRYTLFSASRRIKNIPRNERAIVVICMYMHVLAFHYSVLRERMVIIRRSVENLLNNNKQSIVMIKAPHTFENMPSGSLSDYGGYVYSKILFEVFDGLHDRVVLLNNRDATLAQHVKWNHPPANIVNAMIDQMLSYACDP